MIDKQLDPKSSMTRMISFWVLIASIVLVGALFYRVMANFLLPLFLAVLMVVIFQPLYERILARCKFHRHLAATLATLAVVLVVFVPTVLMIWAATNEAVSMGKRFDASKVTGKLAELREKIGLEMPLAEEVHLLDESFEAMRQLPSGGRAVVPAPLDTPRAANNDPPPDVAACQSPDSSAPDSSAPDSAAASSATSPRPDATPADSSPPVAAPVAPGAPGDATPAAVPLPAAVDGVLYSSAAAHELGTRLAKDLRTFAVRLADLPDAELKASRETLGRSIDALLTILDDETRYVTLDQFELAMQEVDGHWEELKLNLLGGPLQAGLTELANPSPLQLKRWKDELLGGVQTWLLPVTNVAAGFVVKLLFGTIIMIVSVYFFFVDGPAMVATIMRITPLDIRHQTELLEEFANISRAVVLATLLSAVVQGVLAGLGFWVAGIHSVAFLVFATTLLAMIPFVGAVAVWVPVCVWLLVIEGRTTAAIVLAVYCAVIVSQSDNVVKPMILRGKSKLHPLLALLSILGGVQTLGPIGILVGPMLVVFLQTLLNILQRELISLEAPDAPASPRESRRADSARPTER